MKTNERDIWLKERDVEETCFGRFGVQKDKIFVMHPGGQNRAEESEFRSGALSSP